MSETTEVATSLGRGGVEVELRGLSRFFKETTALKSLSMRAEPGELVVLLGPSGCGKTTALRMLAGLDAPDEGNILIAGKDVTSLPAAKRNIGMVFQSYSLFPNMTARENVEFGLRVRGQKSKERSERSDEMLSLVGLSSMADRFPHQLSGGQQQRVALARALAIKPQLLLLDEPLSALDAKVRAQLREEIRRIQLELGITTFFVTHDQEEALALADRIAVMHQGRLEQLDTPLSVYSSPATEFVAEFVGTVNRLRGVVVDSETVDVELVGKVAYRSGQAMNPGSRVQVLIRPESLGVTPANDDGAEVLSRSFLGASTKLSIRNPSGNAIVVEVSVAEAAGVADSANVKLFARGEALLVRPAAG